MLMFLASFVIRDMRSAEICSHLTRSSQYVFALPAINYFEVQAQAAPVGIAVLAFVVGKKFQDSFAMNRADVERAIAAGAAPVDMVHTGSCRGMGLVSEDVHGTWTDEAGVVWINYCTCCSTPPQCTTCKHVYDIMRQMLVEELERRRQVEADSQNSPGPSEQKRPAE